MSILCTGFHTGFDSGRREISGGKLYSALGVSNCKPTIYGNMSILCTGFHTGFDSGRREISGVNYIVHWEYLTASPLYTVT